MARSRSILDSLIPYERTRWLLHPDGLSDVNLQGSPLRLLGH